MSIASLQREIERLKLWLRRIDNINDDPSCFNAEIDRACADALAGKPMTGKITVVATVTCDCGHPMRERGGTLDNDFFYCDSCGAGRNVKREYLRGGC